MALQLGLHPSPGACTTVAVSGELDAASVPELRAVLDLVELGDGAEDVQGHGLAAVDSWRPTVLLDLSGLAFVDSHGLAGILDLRDRCQAAGGELVLLRPNRLTRHLLDVLGADVRIAEPASS